MKTHDWKSIEEAKALLIGHDPRLKKSNIIDDYALFADYYFRPEPNSKAEKQKFGLAKSTFEYFCNTYFKCKNLSFDK